MVRQRPDEHYRRSLEGPRVKKTDQPRVGLRASQRLIEDVDAEWNAKRQEDAGHAVRNGSQCAHRHLDLEQIKKHRPARFGLHAASALAGRVCPARAASTIACASSTTRSRCFSPRKLSA